AKLVERQQRDVVILGVPPHVPGGPVGERADLPQDLAALEGEWLDVLQIRARSRLLPPQARVPRVVAPERGEERTDLVTRAALVGACPPQADGRFRRAEVDQIELPAL